MTTAQKNNAIKFKQAIAYRKKTGVTLKEAFAKIYGKKVSASPKKKVAGYIKTIRKGSKTDVIYSKIVKRKKIGALPKKKVAPKKAAKKHTRYGKVKAHLRRVAGMGNINKQALEDYSKNKKRILVAQFAVKFNKDNGFKNDLEKSKKYLKELQIHERELKKYL